jgi:beta-galactosidase/beta-glucuronidase
MDMFHPRLTNPSHRPPTAYTHAQLLSDAVESNFNMIRLWGGGQYETDEFL